MEQPAARQLRLGSVLGDPLFPPHPCSCTLVLLATQNPSLLGTFRLWSISGIFSPTLTNVAHGETEAQNKKETFRRPFCLLQTEPRCPGGCEGSEDTRVPSALGKRTARSAPGVGGTTSQDRSLYRGASRGHPACPSPGPSPLPKLQGQPSRPGAPPMSLGHYLGWPDPSSLTRTTSLGASELCRGATENLAVHGAIFPKQPRLAHSSSSGLSSRTVNQLPLDWLKSKQGRQWLERRRNFLTVRGLTRVRMW